MNIQQFVEKLEKGAITDFTPYVNGKKIGFRVEMAKRGICVEELAQKEEPTVIKELIQYGYAKEHYNKWALLDDEIISETLATNNHCIDIVANSKHDEVILTLICFRRAKDKWEDWAQNGSTNVKKALIIDEKCAAIIAHDKIETLRAMAVKAYPEFVTALIGKKGVSTFEAMRDALSLDENPEQNIFDYYMQLRESYDAKNTTLRNDVDSALAEKYAAHKMESNPLESAMTWEQLYAANHPRWMVTKTAREILKLQK